MRPRRNGEKDRRGEKGKGSKKKGKGVAGKTGSLRNSRRTRYKDGGGVTGNVLG